ncbi:hypothetical protein ACFLRX_02565 [Acidobacteriota bacterium]
MKQKILPVLFMILLLPQFSNAVSIRPIFIFGLGGGYSMIGDGGIRSGEYVYDSLIDFKEKLRLKNLWSFNLQAYFLRNFGIQFEYTHQKVSYFSDLKWYGWWDSSELIPVYVPINHFEDPTWSQGSLNSFCAAIIIGGNSPLLGELFPYATAGIGFHKMQGDRQNFLNRTRLDSVNQGMTVKISGGVRHRILPFLGLNLKITGETLWGKHGRIGMERNYNGPDQLNLALYYQTGEIFRSEQAMVKAFTYLSIEINLEIILKMPQRSDK